MNHPHTPHNDLDAAIRHIARLRREHREQIELGGLLLAISACINLLALIVWMVRP
jgi:hypothetical protein